MNKHRLRIFLFYLPLVILGLISLYRTAFFKSYQSVFFEDGVVEYMQFVLYFTSAVILAIAAFRSIKSENRFVSLMFSLMSLVVLFVAMEEISWGQRIFDFQTPENLQESNVQGELTLHNIGFFHNNLLHLGYIVVGLGGALLSVLRGYLGKKVGGRFSLFLPNGYLVLYFFVTFLFYFYLEIISPIELELRGVEYGWIYSGDQEAVELILSLGIFVYSLSKLKQVSKMQKKG